MDGRFDIFEVISKHMDWLSQRQKMLAGTIADADTLPMRIRPTI